MELLTVKKRENKYEAVTQTYTECKKDNLAIKAFSEEDEEKVTVTTHEKAGTVRGALGA